MSQHRSLFTGEVQSHDAVRLCTDHGRYASSRRPLRQRLAYVLWSGARRRGHRLARVWRTYVPRFVCALSRCRYHLAWDAQKPVSEFGGCALVAAEHPQSQEDVARVLGITRQRVEQIERSPLRRAALVRFAKEDREERA